MDTNISLDPSKPKRGESKPSEGYKNIININDNEYFDFDSTPRDNGSLASSPDKIIIEKSNDNHLNPQVENNLDSQLRNIVSQKMGGKMKTIQVVSDLNIN